MAGTTLVGAGFVEAAFVGAAFVEAVLVEVVLVDALDTLRTSGNALLVCLLCLTHRRHVISHSVLTNQLVRTRKNNIFVAAIVTSVIIISVIVITIVIMEAGNSGHRRLYKGTL